MRSPSDIVGSDEPDSAMFWRWVWDSVRPVLGYVFVGLGLLALLLGWYGASGESLVAKQLPFLISGGLLGIALVVLGNRFLLIEDLRRDSTRIDRIETMVQELHAALLARPDAPGRIAHSLDASSIAAESNGSASYVVLPGGQSFHLQDCPMLEGKERTTTVKAAAAARRGLVPCPLCEPTAATVDS
jgi:hypothetical protein